MTSALEARPAFKVLGRAAGLCGKILDSSGSVQRYLNRHPRRLPAVADRIAVTVRACRTVAEDQDVVELTLTSTTSLPPWHPGAHIDVFLPSGRRRQYSLCGMPDNTHEYRIAVRRVVGGAGGSLEMHELRPGARLEISSPRNAFYLALPGCGSDSARLRFIAGGIGITPILPMLRMAEASGVDWTMLYTGRHLDSLPFLDELACYGERITVRTDDRDGLPAAGELLAGVDERTAVYACGPPAMITAIQRGLPDESTTEFHYERFSPPAVVAGQPFEIQLARSGEVIPVAADETALQAIRRLRPDVAYSCQQGFCGTCVQRVVDGAVEHREQLLSDAQHERGHMLVCVSRARGDSITLDL